MLEVYTHENDIVFVDINKSFAPNDVLQDRYSYDGIHLNADSYLIWKDAILEFVSRVRA